MNPKEYLKDKKVVVMGLGVFGGGTASAKFCFKYGAQVLVTDLRDETVLKDSLKQFTKKEHECMTFVLEEHREKDFETADIVMVNPGVPNTSPFLKIAREHGAVFENDASLFFRFTSFPTIGVTGTRGKTTTVNWIAQLLSAHFGHMEPIGNSSNNPLLAELSKEMKEVRPLSLHVAELSSWQLELLPQSGRAPHVAVITNIYPDHLNRYDGIKDYASAKANIFKDQTSEDMLILNYDNPWCDFFLAKKPLGQQYFFSAKKLPKKYDGIFFDASTETAVLQKGGTQKKIVSLKNFEKTWGRHNVENVLTALLAIHLFDSTVRITHKDIVSLGEIPFRQQTVYADKTIRIINDSTATSPDGLIAAIDRFKGKETVFIAGGTSKNVSFDDVARHIKKHVPPKNLVLLAGSATNDLLASFERIGYKIAHPPFDTLEACVETSLAKKPKILVFSPASASFEKFKNEFDRGEIFNTLITNHQQKTAD